MPEVPLRVKHVGGRPVPEFPAECEPHTEGPRGYGAFADWIEEMLKTHVQRQCSGCGLWTVWEPKGEPENPVGEAPEDGEDVR